MIDKFNIIIIGAGPAGLFAAINIRNQRVLVLEKNKAAGKKLLMSGSGQCNITQSGSISDFFNRYGEKKRFITPALKEFTNADLVEYLSKNGLETITKSSGKIFPKSEDANDVLNLLLNDCRKNKVVINYDEQVNKIEINENKYYIKTNHAEYICDKLIIATGGKSYPSTGSTGDGFRFAEMLGHTIVKPKPALTPVFVKDYKFKEASGSSLNDRIISLFRNGKKIGTNTGDIGFTHWGLSGPGIIDLSRYIEAGDILKVNIADTNQDVFRNELIESAANAGNSTIKKFLKNYNISENIIKLILSNMGISTSTRLAEINKSNRNKIIDAFCEHPFLVQDIGGFNKAMVTAGGVSTDEINSKTMESKLHKNLFFIGEVLDIDGDTGGYNIQAAFSTAFLAGKECSHKL